jgi:hypothetical protein
VVGGGVGVGVVVGGEVGGVGANQSLSKDN